MGISPGACGGADMKEVRKSMQTPKYRYRENRRESSV